MGVRFTRVTVIGPDRRVDLSLPSGAAVATQMPALLRLLGVPPASAPAPWRLTTPTLGPLDPGRSLDDAAVCDGAVLTLTTADEAPAGPFVDDVERAAAARVGLVCPAWAGPARGSVLAGLLAVVVGTAMALAAALPPFPAFVVVAVLAGGAAVGGAALPGPGGAALAGVLVPAGPVLLVLLVALTRSADGARAGPTGRWAAAVQAAGSVAAWPAAAVVLAGAASVGLAAMGRVRRSATWTATGAVLTGVAVAVTGAAHLHLPADRIAGMVLLGSLIAAALAGRAGLAGSGLVGLLGADEAGRPVGRIQVDGAVDRGAALVTGVVRAAGVSAVAACGTLLTVTPSGSPAWIGPALGGTGAVVLTARAHTFSRAAQAGPMVATGVGVAAVAAVTIPARSVGSGPVWVGLALLACAAGCLLAGLRDDVPAVTGARMARVRDAADVLGTLAVLPALVLLYRVVPALTRLWG